MQHGQLNSTLDMVSFGDLPAEIVLHVIENLRSARDVSHLSRLNHRFHRIVEKGVSVIPLSFLLRWNIPAELGSYHRWTPCLPAAFISMHSGSSTDRIRRRQRALFQGCRSFAHDLVKELGKESHSSPSNPSVFRLAKPPLWLSVAADDGLHSGPG